MTVRVTFNNGTFFTLRYVESIRRVLSGVQIKCFGNDYVTHLGVKTLEVIDMDYLNNE